MKILDCTLRDGGYYTNWDFEPDLIHKYLSLMNVMPIEFIELGYRQPSREGYIGEYAYLPLSTIKQCKRWAPNKKFAIMLNLKDINVESAVALVRPLRNWISLIRIATAPEDLKKAACVADSIKQLGFQICINVMYLSKWNCTSNFWRDLCELNGIADLLCMVDSYGSVCPDEIESYTQNVKSHLNIPVGFHGHDNLSLAFANTLAAIKAGCDIVDSTVMGMGRGAGNLKTELLLTYLAKTNYRINLNDVVDLCSLFEHLYSLYHWGTNMPYMISGVNSLPQKDIMSLLSLKRYSVSSIVRRLQNRLKQRNEETYNNFNSTKSNKPVVFIGGGDSVSKHISNILTFLHMHNDMPVCFLSAKHLQLFDNIVNSRYICMIGNEGSRVKKMIDHVKASDIFVVGKCGLEETYIPDFLQLQTYVLSVLPKQYQEAPLAMAIEITRNITTDKHIILMGFDGYAISNSEDMYDMMQENQKIFDANNNEFIFHSLLPTIYKNIKVGSLYAVMSK